MEFELIDGIKYTVGSAEHVQALRKQRDGLQGRADGLQTQLDAVTSRADAAEGERDALRSERQDASDPVKLDALVDERLSLRTKAAAITNGKVTGVRKDGDKIVSMSNREIMIATIQHTDASFKPDDKTSTDYISGRFSGLQPRKDSRASLREDVTAALNGLDPNGKPVATKKSIDQKRADANAKLRNMSAGPLTLTKQA